MPAASSARNPVSRAQLLAAALIVFREAGYANATFEQIAQQANVAVSDVQTQFADKDSLLNALLQAYSPLDDLLTAIDAVEGETAEDLLRDAMRRMVGVVQQHNDFFELAVIDAQINNGTGLASLSGEILPKAFALLDRIKTTGELRPVSDAVLGRTLIALLMGFILSERAMPQIARFAMKLFPQRAWLDGMVDLLLYGVIEDDQR